MFNNPFREQAVAASADRQQLDRLLRVTAPHERIVLAAVGSTLVATLVGVGAWVLCDNTLREVVGGCVRFSPAALLGFG